MAGCTHLTTPSLKPLAKVSDSMTVEKPYLYGRSSMDWMDFFSSLMAVDESTSAERHANPSALVVAFLGCAMQETRRGDLPNDLLLIPCFIPPTDWFKPLPCI